MVNEKHTKWGTAKIDIRGYYVITTKEKGYKGRLVHNLIWLEHYKRSEIPEGYVIHHKDGNKLNNDITNLELMSRSEHTSLHNKWRIVSEETRQKLSEVNSGKNNPFHGEQHTEKAKRKMAESHKKYTLWDVFAVTYYKGKGEGTRCFYLRFNHKQVNIGGFHDFTTVELISDLIEWCLL